MRRYLLAYPVWNKQDMIEWLIDGIVENIDPARADVLFMFTNCTDRSYEAFKACAHKLNGFSWKSIKYAGTNTWELDYHNILIDIFQDLDKYQAMIVPQDDNRLNGKNLLDSLDIILTRYGMHIGLIGGRDGYNYGYQDMVGSQFTVSAHCRRKLATGDYEERIMLNTGPLVYSKSLVKINGLHDSKNKIYAMDDYALRAHVTHGLTNIILGMDIIHEKFGQVSPTIFFENQAAIDLAALNEKWRPILGHNVH